MTESPRILLARKDLPVNNLQEFVAYVKANQSKMQFGSAGVGSGTHLPCVLLNLAMGVNVTHVPYRGEGPVMQDLIGDRIDYHVRDHPDRRSAGQARHRQRHRGDGGQTRADHAISPPAASRVCRAWKRASGTAFFLPKGTPDAIVRKLNKAMSDTVDDPAIRKRLEELGLEIVPKENRTPEYLAKYSAGGSRTLGQGDQGRRHRADRLIAPRNRPW